MREKENNLLKTELDKEEGLGVCEKERERKKERKRETKKKERSKEREKKRERNTEEKEKNLEHDGDPFQQHTLL